jgi:23S rRNA (uracil1939-C5)-methyltransferase
VPPHSFLQPTRYGERILQDAVCDAVGRVARVADLFAGCGTFTFALARSASVHAVDSDRPALSALEGAARKAEKLKPVTSEARNLFSEPLQPAELKRCDACVLDPPRAGAGAQSAMLARSVIRRVAYVSCNPESFARDARILADGGFRIAWIRPVDQFLWSSHIEFAALLERH